MVLGEYLQTVVPTVHFLALVEHVGYVPRW